MRNVYHLGKNANPRARLLGLVALLAVLAAGCGVPSEPKKQAEEVESVAAEGALLAHDAAAGKSTGPFTRVHARELRRRLAGLRPKIVQPELARIAARVTEALQKLEDEPFATDVEADLDQAAEAAGKLAK